MGTPLRDREFSEDEPVVVSACVISFNHAGLIEDCLNGILDQVCDFRVEVVIYDDGSTDGTPDIIQRYADAHPTIFRAQLYGENMYSKGVNPYFAYVFPKARGRYIAICDGDDFWRDPQKLSLQVGVMEREPDVALTYGTVKGVSDDGGEVPYSGGNVKDLSAAELKLGQPLNTLTACFRNIYENQPVPLFIRTATIGDLTVWAMLGYEGRGKFLPDLKPAHYRVHAQGLISMQGQARAQAMTAVAYMHLAAYHWERGDIKAAAAIVTPMIKLFNKLGIARLKRAVPWKKLLGR